MGGPPQAPHFSILFPDSVRSILTIGPSPASKLLPTQAQKLPETLATVSRVKAWVQVAFLLCPLLLCTPHRSPYPTLVPSGVAGADQLTGESF